MSELTAPRGTVVHLVIESKVLQKNPLGDPCVRALPVYLPPGYERGSRRFPVIHVLSGFLGAGQALLNWTFTGEPLDRRLDRLLAERRIAPCIVALPDATTSLGGSQYLNSRGTGRYADYFTEEVVPHVDRAFRTLAEPAHRAVMGKSSGGYGALVHAMRRPDLFGAVASHSGDMYFEYGYLPDFPKACTAIGEAGGLAQWLERYRGAKKKSSSLIATLNIVAMAACYSPGKTGLPDLPFDVATGRLRDKVWARWLENDPLRLLEHHKSALRGMRLVFLDGGRRDEWNLHLGARMFAARARELGVEVVHEEFDDGHMDVSYRFDVSFPLLSQAIGA